MSGAGKVTEGLALPMRHSQTKMLYPST